MLTGVSTFLFFRNLRLRRNRFVNLVSASTFGVLLIHAHSEAMRKWLWKDTLDNVGIYDSAFMPIHAIGSVLAIFVICVLVDRLRIIFVEKPFFKWWDKHESAVFAKIRRIEEGIVSKLGIRE